MKKIFFMMSGVLVFSMILFACTSAKAPTVGKNADLSADFKNINSYSWSRAIDNIPKDQLFIGPNGVLIFNNESGRKMIKDAIQYELDTRGYKMNAGEGGEMIVSYLVLEQPGSLRTTNGYVTVSSGEKVRTEDNVSYTDVKPGTLIVNFIDAKTSKQIWQGFASGILRADQMRDESKVRQAVSKIFSEFKYNNNM